MRIVQLNPFHYPYMGGIEHRIHNISKRLAKDHKVVVLTGKLEGTIDEEYLDGYRIVRLKSRIVDIYNPPFISSVGIREKLIELKPDVIDFHYRWAPSYTRSISSLPIPRVFTFHNTFGEGAGASKPLSMLNDLMFKDFLRKCQRVVCVSHFVMNDLVWRGIPRETLSTVPNGVDPAQFPSSDGEFALFIGRLVNTKGLPHLIEAMRSTSVRLVIAGSGPERARLERMVQRHGLGERVEFKGRVSEEEKHRLLSQCRFFVMPSTFESYGIAAAEAMTYGKAVIASNVGGLPEVVDGGGILVRPSDPKAIETAINELDANKRMREELGSIALQQSKRYSWEGVAKEMERVYFEVFNCHLSRSK